MKDKYKTKDQLINELAELRQQIAELEKSEKQYKLIQQALNESEQKPYLLELYKKDGSKVFLEIDESPFKDHEGNVIGIIGAARDITERKRAEEALRESEERSKAKYKGIPIPTYTWQKVDNDFVLIDYNLAAEEITQGKVSDWLGAKLSEMYKDMPHVIEQMWQCFNEKTIIKTEMLYKFRSFKKERVFAVHYSYAPPDLVLVHAEDITERKLAEEALKESEKRYRNLADNALVGIYKTNLKGNILYVNATLSSMLEFELPEEMTSVSVFTRYKNPKDREVLIGGLKKKGRISNFETELLTKTGKSKNVILNATLEGDVISGMIIDITERKRIEEALRESEKNIVPFLRIRKMLSILPPERASSLTSTNLYWISLAILRLR